jgi:hypothetical protein
VYNIHMFYSWREIKLSLEKRAGGIKLECNFNHLILDNIIERRDENNVN